MSVEVAGAGTRFVRWRGEDVAHGGIGEAQSAWLGARRLSVVVHSLFSAWMLSFLFEGQMLRSCGALRGSARIARCLAASPRSLWDCSLAAS